MSTILYNIIDQDPSILNSIYLEKFWENIPVTYRDVFILDNMETFPMAENYNFRPDIISYKVYGNDLYYPIILYSNNINSILQFKIEKIGPKIFYLKPEYLSTLKL